MVALAILHRYLTKAFCLVGELKYGEPSLFKKVLRESLIFVKVYPSLIIN